MRRRAPMLALVGLTLAACGLDALGTATTPDAGTAPDASRDSTAPIGDGDALDVAVGDIAETEEAGCGAVDLNADSHNCGACGHDCLGTTCAAGRCQAVELVGGQSAPLHLALDVDNVYWTNSTGGTIESCPKAGCAASVQLASNQGAVDRIVAAFGGLFWTNYGSTIGYCALPGCSGGPQNIATGQTSTVGIAADATNAYFTTNTDGFVKACARAGCGSNPAVLAGGQVAPVGMGLGGGSLVWTDLGTGGATGAVVGCTLPGCPTLTPYAAAMESPAFVAADSQRVYWTTQGVDPTRQGAVWSCPLAGCGGVAVPLVTGQTFASVIVVDGPNLYWSNGGHYQAAPPVADGEIVRCAAVDCAATLTVLASGYLRPWGIAVDATHVYWTATGNGTVLRVAK